ncbi:glycoside hydrolase [uncultured Nonlabens sp.]|uniref:glycoside hydrolase family 113 n=1 Tax=uncultured Nonlabens sp. TaxID=859306 RepID=UPI00263056A3|nr:glycoside hydrolase [uncultured Nonlabens sp.]
MNFFLYLLILLSAFSCLSQTPRSTKINGISFVATRDTVKESSITPLKKYHANYAAVIPYAWMRSLEEPLVIFNEREGWWGEKSHGVSVTSRHMKDQNLKVLLKPQLWIGRGQYTGHINLKTDAEWKILEDSYTAYIMRFAQVAAQENISMFCIGTELDSFVKGRPAYWQKLIKDIRKIYKGKLTYAGNWDSYKYVSFWGQLDYIGVDAYFPISEEKTPDHKTITNSWKKWKKELKDLSNKYNKQILFTEYGYISADYAGKEPWANAGEDKAVNQEAQHILLEGLYNNVWHENWMAGGFLWKHHPTKGRRSFEKRFTTQDKKAQKTVHAAYSKQYK